MKENKLFRQLTEGFEQFPGVGRKTAERFTYYLLGLSESKVQRFAESMLALRSSLKTCRRCQVLAESDPCTICVDKSRTSGQLCIVDNSASLYRIERGGRFPGRYYVLGSNLSPQRGTTPGKTRLKRLLERIKQDEITDVLLALGTTADGETTVSYLVKLLHPLGVKISRLAFGLPAGSELDSADDYTLARALEGRQEIG